MERALTELLKCPSCGGPMQLGEFKPGDKIAQCPYCGKVVDLPDEQTTQKVTEIEEQSHRGGMQVQRKVKVTESKFTGQAEPAKEIDLKDLLAQFQQNIENPGAVNLDPANPKSGIKGVVNQRTFKATFTTTHSSSSSGNVQLPDDVKKMIQGLGVELPDNAANVTIVHEATSVPTKKPGLLKRLFGKKE
jgi:uncharacterized Zn finger protein (UPF0148 family)